MLGKSQGLQSMGKIQDTKGERMRDSEAQSKVTQRGMDECMMDG